MQFRLISLQDNYAYIKDVRRRMVELHGFEPTEAMLAAWEDCKFHGFFVDGKLVGITEFFRYDWKFGGYRNNVFSDHYDLSEFAPPEKMGHVRTLFLEPEYQRQYKAFMFFYLCGVRAMKYDFDSDYFTMTTTRQPYLMELYEKLGFRTLCSMDKYPGQPPGHLLMLISDINKTLEENPLVSRWNILQQQA